MTTPTPPPTAAFVPAHTLLSRTYIGLLVAQFLAAFNDQAIHASAMFFAIHKKTLTEASAISLMPILFYAPWCLFPTIAGWLADRYSKQTSLRFWKLAEVGICALALVGFVVGTSRGRSDLGSWVVLSTVFLMGTHSAFFVPAKYGAMPEILAPEVLSRGNGVLESFSFLAVILGTVCGGLLSFYFQEREAVIGVVLLGLAVLGAASSLLIQRMEPANPTRPFPPYVFGPLLNSLRVLMRPRPLLFAVVGIAFFTFVVAFMRSTVYMLGESRIPRWNELQTSGIVGMTALGIGLGSPLAGWLSGKKVELGLIPIGAIGMIVATCLGAVLLDRVVGLIACIIAIGFFTGFYLVPMFTLLQHRAPKQSKGDAVATSNFVNVTGAIASSVIFFVLVAAAHRTGVAPLVAQEDDWATGELKGLQMDKHHRPVYFLVDEFGDGVSGKQGGKRNMEEDDTPLWTPSDEDDKNLPTAQVLVSQRALVAWHQFDPLDQEYKEAVKAGQPAEPPPPVRVRVSRYTVKGVPHYYVRLQGEDLPRKHDNRQLPRYLFLGAAAMTLLTLLLLLRLLPDLPQRALWVIKTHGRSKLSVFGTHHMPGYGPVLLLTTGGPTEREHLALGSDRIVRFVGAPEAELAGVLDRGEVAAVVIDGPGMTANLDKILDAARRDGVAWVPVYCGPEPEDPATPVVAFGPAVPHDWDLPRLQDAIRRAASERGE